LDFYENILSVLNNDKIRSRVVRGGFPGLRMFDVSPPALNNPLPLRLKTQDAPFAKHLLVMALVSFSINYFYSRCKFGREKCKI
jgi:hypothetical protein